MGEGYPPPAWVLTKLLAILRTTRKVTKID